jgi:hypothetical protein
MKAKRKTMYNLVYRLRKKGFLIATRNKEIAADYLSEPLKVRQVRRLVNEFNFNVQFQIV